MENVFWVGVYPGLDDARIDYILDVLRTEVAHRTRRRTGAR